MSGTGVRMQRNVESERDEAATRAFAQAAALGPAPISPPSAADADAVRRQRGLAALTRGMLLARRRRFEAARAAFAEALRADADLDLFAEPGFWNLERSAHLAAIDACRDAGRERAAMLLEAKLAVVYRPRLLPRPAADKTG
ncbi:MAG TPA: hypothetical protein VFQ80_17960 [Thermomicrobiales bacterium]|nr:hypothetical protein [Thermomicrobiales bacterium]